MKARFALLALGVLCASGAQENPLSKVIGLMDELTAKVMADGEAADKAYKEFFEWCDDVTTEKRQEIETATKMRAKLEAIITKSTDDAAAASTKIEELAERISNDEEDLKEATKIRKKEAANFAKEEAELVEAVDTLGRAIGILEKEMAKNPAAFTQVDRSNMDSLIKSLTVVIDAAAFNSADRQKLVALVQSQQSDSDDDMGAPAPDAYQSHSTNIVEVLQDLLEKAEDELSELRKAETQAKHNFDMMRQSLEAQIAQDNKNMNEQKAAKARAVEEKADAEKELEVTVKDLENGKKTLADTQSDCMRTAADHEASISSRKEELAVIAKAKQILVETTGGAAEQTYSFLQMRSKLQTGADLAAASVVVMVKKIAKEQHSAALKQLASRITAVLQYGAGHGADPFVKVRGLIADMIAKLEKEAEADATEKAYCDEQMAKTEAKKGELEDDIEKLTGSIDKAAVKSGKLKAEVKETQAALAALAKAQAEMDKIRGEEHAAYKKNKAELEQGLFGVRKALGVLRDYYASDAAAMLQQPAVPMHSKSSGAGGGIIDILEVCESDFAKNLANVEAEEADSASEYDKITQENAETKAVKDQDEKYMTQEYKALDESVTQLSGDRAAAEEELKAVMEYYAKVKDRCIAKPETYEERKKRREAEIAGLKEALSILENETALIQRRKRGNRGAAFLGRA